MPPIDTAHSHDANQKPPTSDTLFAAAYSHGAGSSHDFGSSLHEFGSAFSDLGGAIASGYQSLSDMDRGVRTKAGEIGQSIVHAVGGAIDATGREMSRENPEIPAAGSAIAGAYNRVADFARTRPATFAAESVLPGLSIIDGLARGGLPEHHDAKPPQPDAAPPHQDVAPPQPAAPPTPTEAQQHHTPSAVPGRQAPEHDPRHPDQPATTPAHGDGTAHPAHKTAEVHDGDGYWSVARRILGHNSSNMHVAELAHKMQSQNGGKVLQPGDKLTY